ncbi:MAG: TolC family protein [Zavarzinella sp.]
MLRWKVMRWKKLVLVALGVVVPSSGCVRPLFMTPETQHLALSTPLPENLATDPQVATAPDVSGHLPPPTVLDAKATPRPITLAEAFAIGVEQGSTGSQGSSTLAGLGTGTARFGQLFSDELVTFNGRGVGGDDAIRAFALDPAIAAADIEGALAKFDTQFFASMNWQKRDQLVANIFNNFNNGDLAQFTSGLYKPLPTGGMAGITFNTNYTRIATVPQGFAVINPSYQPELLVRFEQPLLRNFGVDINQLLPQHPGSVSFPQSRPSGGRAEGILITRMRTDQSKAQFERSLNFMLLNIENAYWQLYSAYFAKYAAEIGLYQAGITLDLFGKRKDAGFAARQDVAQTQAQFENFRGQYVNALQQVLATERQLRGLLGMPLTDGTRLIPADSPNITPFKPDWSSALAEAMNLRPELAMARNELKIQQLSVLVQENATRPDLRFFANYGINGNGPSLDGPAFLNVANPLPGGSPIAPNNAFGNMFQNRFQNWELGLRFEQAIGARDAHAALMATKLNLARSHIVLRNQERKAEFQLGGVLQELTQSYEQIKIQRARRKALQEQLQAQTERIEIGRESLIVLLQNQIDFVNAIQQEHQAIANYNIALAGWQYSKGTIQQFNNITIAEGALPSAVAERAADHFAAQAAGIKLRERQGGLPSPESFVAPSVAGLADQPVLPDLMNGGMVPPDKLPMAPGSTDLIPPAPGVPKDPKPMEKKTSPLLMQPRESNMSGTVPLPPPPAYVPAIPNQNFPVTTNPGR